MIRATTPRHTFTFPDGIDPGACERIRLTYAQGKRVILTLEGDALEIDGQDVSHTFTQAEANLFSAASRATAQIRILTDGGDALASDLIPIEISDVLDDEVLV